MPFLSYCPDCREPLEVDDAHRGWRVRCPRCRHEFVADGDDAPRPRRRRDRDDDGGDTPPPAPPPRAADDDPAPFRMRDEDAEPLRPSRRRRPRRREYDDDEVLDRAGRAVAGPASWFRVVGVLGVLAGVAGTVGAVFMGMWVADDPAKAARDMGALNEEEAVVNTIVLGVCSALSLVVGGLMTYGAIKMGRLESHGWGIATSVLAITSVLFCTCCLVAGLPLGVWGLVVLSRPDVREGFEITARRQGRGYDRDDDY